jgi:hypothetical protein
MRLFSCRDHPVYLGSHPLQRLTRQVGLVELSVAPAMRRLSLHDANRESPMRTMTRHNAMLDRVRVAAVNPQPGELPSDRVARSTSAGTPIVVDP